MLLLITVDDPSKTTSASGICTRSLIDALAAHEEVQVLVVPAGERKSVAGYRLRQAVGLVRGKSSVEGAVRLSEVAERSLDAIAELKPRAVLFNHLRTAAVLQMPNFDPGQVPLVYIGQNREAAALESMRRLAATRLERVVLAMDQRRIELLEERVVRRATCVVALTEEDADRFKELGAEVFCLPPILESQAMPGERTASRDVGHISLISSFIWSPKRWNAEWVMGQVMPRVWQRFPELRLQIVGAGAGALGVSDKRVAVHPDVPDVRPFYEAAQIALVPERQVSGLKFKALQAAFAGSAIVSTSPGIEGTGLSDECSALVRDTPDGFADAICDLLVHTARREELGRSARQAVLKRFDPAELEESYRHFVNAL